MASAQKAIPVPLPRRLRRFFKRAVPVAIWIGALGTCVYLMQGGGRTTQFMGAAEALQADVNAQERSTIQYLTVNMFDEVRTGEPLGKLEDSSLNAQLDVLNTSMRVVEARVDAEEARLTDEAARNQRDISIDRRRLEIDVERARLELLDRRTTLQVNEIELQRLTIELRRISGLQKEGTVAVADFDDINLQVQALEKNIEENRGVIGTAEVNLQAGEERLRALREQNPAASNGVFDSYLEPLKTETQELAAQIRELELSRERWLLRAPIDGIVIAIHRRVGEAVAEGDPILTITNTRADHIVAYVPEKHPLPFIDDLAKRETEEADLNIPVSVRRWNAGGPWSEASIKRVGPAVVGLPLRLLSSPNVPEYGVPVQVSVPEDMKVRPGERVVLRISS